MRVANISHGLMRSTIVFGLLLTLNHPAAEGAAARAAKDMGDLGKAVAAAARYFQGPGFIDPMLSAENMHDSLLAVEVDHKGWARMDKGQRMDFIDRVNGAALRANGGVSIDIQISMNGTKVATSTFSAGQQVMRLLE